MLTTDLEETPSAVERAIEFGIDVSLLIANLRLTPTERIQRAQRFLESVIALQAEARVWRERQEQKA